MHKNANEKNHIVLWFSIFFSILEKSKVYIKGQDYEKWFTSMILINLRNGRNHDLKLRYIESKDLKKRNQNPCMHKAT